MHSFAWWPTLAVVGVATFTDLRSRRIPNWLVLPFFIAGLIASTWLHGWAGAEQSLYGALLGFVTYGLLFWMGGMGAGDVKLCAAIGAWIGPSQLLMALVLTSMAGGIMVLGWAIARGFVGELFVNTAGLLFGRGKRNQSSEEERPLANPLRRKIPYAPAIAIGTMVSFFAR